MVTLTLTEHITWQGVESIRVEPQFVDMRKVGESAGVYGSDVVVTEGELQQGLKPHPHLSPDLLDPVVPQP